MLPQRIVDSGSKRSTAAGPPSASSDDRLPSSRCSSLPSGCSRGERILPHVVAQTAWDMLSEEETRRHITTSCEDLDGILGGGVHCKEVTEIGGVPGIGKTQLGIQLAINVQIPEACGGLGGKAIYIDTEGSFMVERAYQIAQACTGDMLNEFAFKKKISQTSHAQMNPNNLLENIFYFRVCSYTEQIAVINHLEKFIMEQRDDTDTW